MTGLNRHHTPSLTAIAAPAGALPHGSFVQNDAPATIEAAGRNFIRYAFGDLTIVALRDGHVDMPTTRLRQSDGRRLDELPSGLSLVDGQLRLSVNAYLVVEGGIHTLIDAGAADTWEPTMGLLLDGLTEAGFSRDSVTAVALTHTHTDHANGLIAADGSEAFPNATHIFVPREEAAIFGTSRRLSGLGAKVSPIDNDFPVSDRIKARAAAGHSLGHTAYEVESGGFHLLIWGDIVHVPSVQFEHPEITWELDGNQPAALKSRLLMLGRAAQANHLVAGAHLDFPGIGRVHRTDESYRFEPLGRPPALRE